jgi:hypothetical protein
MALVERSRKLNAIRYVCKADGAVDEAASDRDLYDSDPMKHADALIFKKGQEPTVFILNFEISGREDALIKDVRIKGVDEDKNPIVAMGSWARKVAKFTIKGIENPPGVKPLVEFKKDGRGYIADHVLDKLGPVGVVEEVWQLFLALRENAEEEKAEVKN